MQKYHGVTFYSNYSIIAQFSDNYILLYIIMGVNTQENLFRDRHHHLAVCPHLQNQYGVPRYHSPFDKIQVVPSFLLKFQLVYY
jgi:hypothetical protein